MHAIRLRCRPRHLRRPIPIDVRGTVCYLRRRLASEGTVTLGVCMCVSLQCVCLSVRRAASARRISLGGEGNGKSGIKEQASLDPTPSQQLTPIDPVQCASADRGRQNDTSLESSEF